MAELRHLVTRFLGSLSPRPLAADDDRWARAQFGDGEARLWERMSRADRKHSVGVARQVARRLGPDATRPVLAAALLHDVGKVDAGLGTFGRVVATVTGAVVGREQARSWQHRRGLRRRIGLYLDHDRLGGDLLALAGADPLTQAWAREHHRSPASWSLPADVARVLHEADDD